MTFKIIIFIIILILFWIRYIYKSKNEIQKKETKFKNNSFIQMKEDRNYAALKKMFFYPDTHSINFVNIKRPNIVYGILIEQSISDKKKYCLLVILLVLQVFTIILEEGLLKVNLMKKIAIYNMT